MTRLVPMMLYTLSLVLFIPGGAAAEATEMRVQEILTECQAAYHRLVDYRGTLRHEIWEKGGAQRQHEIAVTFRKPSSLLMQWQSGLYRGTTLLTRPTRALGTVFIRLGGWFDYVRVSIPSTEISDPFAPALKDVNAWLYALRALSQRSSADRSLQLVALQPGDPQLAEGRVILSVPAFLIPFRDNTVATYEFVIERGTGLPLELILRGASGEVRQRLSYTDLQVNIGISQQVFERESPASGDPSLFRPGTDLDVRGFTQNWLRRAGEIQDYTGVWVTEARREGQLSRRTARFKFRKPFDVYMAWEQESGGLREALFRTGWNRGRVRVRTSLFGIPLIGDLIPDGPWVQRELHYSLKEFGFGQVVERLQTQLLQGWLQSELEVQFRGIQEHDGRPCYVLEFVFPNTQWRTHPYYRIVLHWDIVYRVPVKQEAYDWNNQLDIRYGFQDLRFNVSLNEYDFNSTNLEYGFLLFRRVPWLDWFLTGRE